MAHPSVAMVARRTIPGFTGELPVKGSIGPIQPGAGGGSDDSQTLLPLLARDRVEAALQKTKPPPADQVQQLVGLDAQLRLIPLDGHRAFRQPQTKGEPSLLGPRSIQLAYLLHQRNQVDRGVGLLVTGFNTREVEQSPGQHLQPSHLGLCPPALNRSIKR